MYPILDRRRLRLQPLAARQSKSDLTCLAKPEGVLPPLPESAEQTLTNLVQAMQKAKREGAPIMLTYGAHLFKNGLSPLLIGLMEHGFIQHLATNGAGSIHDWEMAFQGKTEEDVRRYIQEGQFGLWHETGYYLNLAVALGAAQGLGYGPSVGRMIQEEGLTLPNPQALRQEIRGALLYQELPEETSAQANLLYLMQRFQLAPGTQEIPHPYKNFSIQSAAYRLHIPFSVCPGIGYDIIYGHPLNSGVAIGAGALQDFLSFADSVSKLENGVFLAIGSAVMAPQIFEKAMSMARNLALQEGRPLENFYLLVNDIQPGSWDWSQGEPPKNHPAYYLRFCKSFARMGGRFEYLELDNTLLLHHLYQRLVAESPKPSP